MSQEAIPPHVRQTIQELRSDMVRLRNEGARIREETVTTEKALSSLEDKYGGLSTAGQATKVDPGAGRAAADAACPLTVDEMRTLGDKYDALYATAELMPDRVVHARTAGKWLINAGLMPDQIDNARVAIVSHMKSRPGTWEQVGRGTFRLIRPRRETEFDPESEGETRETEPACNDSSSLSN